MVITTKLDLLKMQMVEIEDEIKELSEGPLKDHLGKRYNKITNRKVF